MPSKFLSFKRTYRAAMLPSPKLLLSISSFYFTVSLMPSRVGLTIPSGSSNCSPPGRKPDKLAKAYSAMSTALDQWCLPGGTLTRRHIPHPLGVRGVGLLSAPRQATTPLYHELRGRDYPEMDLLFALRSRSESRCIQSQPRQQETGYGYAAPLLVLLDNMDRWGRSPCLRGAREPGGRV